MDRGGKRNDPGMGATSLSFAINHPNAFTTLNGVGFTDTSQAGLMVPIAALRYNFKDLLQRSR